MHHACLNAFVLIGLLIFGCKHQQVGDLAETSPLNPEGSEASRQQSRRASFLPSIHGTFPPVGERPGVILNIRLGRFGGYNSNAVDAAVEALSPRGAISKDGGSADLYVIVAIDAQGVSAPARIISNKVKSED